MALKPYVEVSGTGPALVLIHGWGLHGGIWQTVLTELQQEFTVYNVDMPGFGRSPVHNGDYDLEYLVSAIGDILPDRCFLLGWSLGGMVATALALKHPDKIQKLITVASNPCFVADDQWKYGMQAKVLETFIEYLQEDYEGTLIRFLGIQTMGSATQKEDIKQLKETVFIHGKPSHKALRGGLQILHDANLIDQLAQLSMPILRIYGRLDSLVPMKVAEDVTEYLPHSQSIIYHRSAHAPFLSAKASFVSDVSQFLLAEITAADLNEKVLGVTQ